MTSEEKLFNKQDEGGVQASKAGEMWKILVDFSKDCKSARLKKGQCLKDHHRRYVRV